MRTAIRVEGLGKRYLLHHKGPTRDNVLRHALTDAVGEMRKRWLSPGPRESRPSVEEFWALRDVSLEIKEGERIGIIGRNGAGKSTLLKILSRITDPSEGRVSIRGRMASLLEVGTGFHQDLSGRENIFLNGAVLGMSKREIARSFDKIVDFAGVERFLDTPVKRYSSGMYVRLAFAVAAHLEPEILVVDEVLAVGDAEFQKKCMGRMSEVGREGRTILFVSHNMVAVNTLCSSAVLLKDGRVFFKGNVGDAVEHYLSDASTAAGEVMLDTPDASAENGQVRLKAVRIVAEGVVTGKPSMTAEIEIQVDYQNLDSGRRLVSVHLLNAMGMLVFASSNMDIATLVPDPWVRQTYPRGLFRTSCFIPASLLNNGLHSIDIYVNGTGANDNIILRRNAISFEVQEPAEGRSDYLGEWIGAIRPRLNWRTKQLE